MSLGLSMDVTMDPMVEMRVMKKFAIEHQGFLKKYPFSLEELQKLTIIFYKLKMDSGGKALGISKIKFIALLHDGFDMTDNILMDRVVACLEKGCAVHPSYIFVETWIRAMAIFFRSTLEEKIDYCFNVYTLSGDGLIGRDTMFFLLKKSILTSGSDDDPEEQVKDLCDILTKKFDKDRDGKISYNDFKQTVLEQPLLLECFGQCLPTRLMAHTFALTIFLPDAVKL